MECGLCGRPDINAQSLTSENAVRIFSRVTKVFTLQTKFCTECYNTLKKLYKTGKKKELLRRKLEKEAIASLITVASENDTIRNNSSSNDVVSPKIPAPRRVEFGLAFQQVGPNSNLFEDRRSGSDEETNSDQLNLVSSTSTDLSITASQSPVASFVSASVAAIVQPENAEAESLISEINGSNQLNHSVPSNPVSSRAGNLRSDVVSSNVGPIAPHRIQRTNVDFPIFRRVHGG